MKHEYLLTMVKWRQLTLFGHVTRWKIRPAEEQMVAERMEDPNQRRWVGNTRDWSSLDFQQLISASEQPEIGNLGITFFKRRWYVALMVSIRAMDIDSNTLQDIFVQVGISIKTLALLPETWLAQCLIQRGRCWCKRLDDWRSPDFLCPILFDTRVGIWTWGGNNVRQNCLLTKLCLPN